MWHLKQFNTELYRKIERYTGNIKFILNLFRFLGSDDPDSFFTRAQRSRMVYEILATAAFGKEKKGEVGIERMVEEGVYNAAFPLHDVSTYSKEYPKRLYYIYALNMMPML